MTTRLNEPSEKDGSVFLCIFTENCESLKMGIEFFSIS